MKTLIRSVGPKREFQTLSSALDNLPETIQEGKASLRIEIAPSTYMEKVNIRIPKIEIIGTGASRQETVIYFSDAAKDLDLLGEALGTFRTPSVYIDADYCHIENLSIENRAGLGKDVGQAVALAINVAHGTFKNVHLAGDQDTLFLAPLPDYAVQPRGFLGSEQWTQRISTASVFQDCSISGGVDFIFGGGAAYFQDCELISDGGYITAASTAENQRYGFLFDSCTLSSSDPNHKTYLGRPWRSHAKTAFYKCYLGEHIHHDGWHDWNKEDARDLSSYEEYGNYGPGSATDKRPSWVHILKKLPEHYTLEAFCAYFNISLD